MTSGLEALMGLALMIGLGILGLVYAVGAGLLVWWHALLCLLLVPAIWALGCIAIFCGAGRR